jgi:hypothetical protein
MKHPLATDVRDELLQKLDKTLFANPLREINLELISLIQQNSRLCNNSQPVLMFRDGLYQYEAWKREPKSKERMNQLQRGIRPAFKDYLDKSNELTRERDLVLGYLHRITNLTDRLEDYTRLFPSALAQFFQAYDWLLAPVPGHLSDDEVTALMEESHWLLGTMKHRMLYNFIDSD